MKVEEGKIVEATESELFKYWLTRGYDDIYSFLDFKARMELAGTKIVEEERMEKYSWSFDETAELWGNDTHDTIEECIAEAEEANKENGEENDTVYIGENIPFTISVDAVSVLERIEEEAGEFAGESADGWDTYEHRNDKELEELSCALTEVVNDWLKKYGREPHFWQVDSIKAFPLKQGDTNET